MRRRLAPTLMVLLATAACATGSEFSPQPPPLYGEPKLWVPAWHSAKLANGLVVHVNSDPNLPLVSVALAIRGGRLAEPLEKAGLTYVLANSMITRTAHLSRPELAQVFDRVGGVPNVSVMPDGVVFRLDVLDDALPMAVKLLAALVMDAGSDETSLARVRAEHRGLLESLESSPAAAGIQGLRQVVYGVDHPLGLPWAGPHRTVAALTVADLEERYLQVVRPSNIVIAIAGRTSLQATKSIVESFFGTWRVETPAKPLAKPAPPPPAKRRSHVYYIERPGLAQTLMYVGRQGLPDKDPRYWRLRSFNRRVVGSAGHWLRRIENVTYGVGAIDEVNNLGGLYGANASVDAKATGPALETLVDRFDALPGGFFDIEKVVILTSLGSDFFTLSGRTSHVAHLYLRGLPLDHWSRLRQLLDDMRPQDYAQEVGHDYIRSAELEIVLVGDPEVITQQVPKLGLGRLQPLTLAL